MVSLSLPDGLPKVLHVSMMSLEMSSAWRHLAVEAVPDRDDHD